MKTLIEFIYSIGVGIAIALFVGFGIWALYPGPQMPDYPTHSYSYSAEGPSAEEQKSQEEFGKKMDQYEKDKKPYGQEVSMIALAAAALFYLIGLASSRLAKVNEVLSEGLMIGGIFSATYAMIRASESDHRTMAFVSVATILLMVLTLAYLKFRPVVPKRK